MAVIPKQPTQGLASEFAPLMGCGVAMFDNIDLGWPDGTVIPDSPGILKSNPLMVAGYHQFLLILITTSTGGTAGDFLVIICDPTSGAELVTETQGPGQLYGNPLPFGAFTQTLTASRSWYVIKLGLTNTLGVGGAVIGSALVPFPTHLLCQTR